MTLYKAILVEKEYLGTLTEINFKKKKGPKGKPMSPNFYKTAPKRYARKFNAIHNVTIQITQERIYFNA